MSKNSRPRVRKDDPLRPYKKQALEVCYDLGYLPMTAKNIAKAENVFTINQALTHARTSGEIGSWSWGVAV